MSLTYRAPGLGLQRQLLGLFGSTPLSAGKPTPSHLAVFPGTITNSNVRIANAAKVWVLVVHLFLALEGFLTV